MDTNAPDDVASASMLQIREEGSKERMYIASHETNKVMFREKERTEDDDSHWSQIATAFTDDSPLVPVKYFQQVQHHGIERWAAYPYEASWSPSNNSPNYESPRIGSMLAHSDNYIYYCTTPMYPDFPMNGDFPGTDNNEFFFQRQIKYQRPIENPHTGQLHACDPLITTTNPSNPDYPKSVNHPGCTIAANEIKPIDWFKCWETRGEPLMEDNCLYPPDGDPGFSDSYPLTSELRTSYHASIKVAIPYINSSGIEDWEIRTVANIHDSCAGLAEDPINGDILVSGTTNIKILSYDLIHKQLADFEDHGEPHPNVDLAYKRSDGIYTSNNVLDNLTSPDSEDQSIELKKLSGINVQTDLKNLNVVFTDMTTRVAGYVVQQRNDEKKKLFAQILYNDDNGNIDRNLDKVAVFPKNKVDKGEYFATWIMSNTSTKAWGDTMRLDENGRVKYPMPAPIPIRPLTNITDYSASAGNHKRELSTDDGACFSSYDIEQICPEGDQGDCICGQSPLYRNCESDVLSQINVGLSGRQTAGYGCGIGEPAPTPLDEPGMVPATPEDPYSPPPSSPDGDFVIDPDFGPIQADPVTGLPVSGSIINTSGITYPVLPGGTTPGGKTGGSGTTPPGGGMSLP